jgi:hypothetical protein
MKNFEKLPNFLSSRIETKLKAITGMVSRNRGRSLIKVLLQIPYVVMGEQTCVRVKFCSLFSFHVYKIWKGSGVPGVVIYLKASQVLLQQAVGGQRISDLSPLKVRVKRSRSGFPRFIPVTERKKLREGNVEVTRFWMTLMGLYRVLEFPGKLKLSTIYEGGKEVLDYI